MKLSKWISLIGSLGLAASSVSVAEPWKDPVSMADWSVNAKPSVLERGLDKVAIARFMDNLRGVDDKASETAEPPAKPEQVGEYKWFDIDNDGVYELFVTFAETRGFFSGPTIFKSVRDTKALLQVLPGNMLYLSLDKALEDLSGDGTPEILIPRNISPSFSGAANPKSIWMDIYQWNGKNFQMVSEKFKSFYTERLLPQVEARIEDLKKRGVQPTSHEFAVQIVLRDKIIRFAGQNTHAGIDLAREWVKSQDKELRRLALDVFGDAGVGAYQADIQFLVSDPDPYVANYAKMKLRETN